MATFGGELVGQGGQQEPIVPGLDAEIDAKAGPTLAKDYENGGEAQESVPESKRASSEPAKKPGLTFDGTLLQENTTAVKGQPEEEKGLFNTLKNPWTLWLDESLPARVYKAAKDGTFDKPLGELVQEGKTAVQNFSIRDLWEAAKEHPGQFAGELVNSIVADPELLFAPLGLGGKVVQTMGKAGKIAGVAGRVIETGTMGAGIASVDSAAKQLADNGSVDPRRIMQDMKVGAVMGAALGTAVHLGADLAKRPPAEIYEAIQAKVKDGFLPDEAVEKAFAEMNISRDQAASVGEAMKGPWDLELKNKALQEEADPQITQMTKEFAKEAGPEVMEQTGAQARKELGTFAGELQQERLKQEATDTEFAGMTEDLKKQQDAWQSQVARTAADNQVLNQAKNDAASQAAANFANPVKQPLSEGVIIGSAQAAETKPPFLRSADDLIAIKRAELYKEYSPLLTEKPAPASKGFEIPSGYRTRKSVELNSEDTLLPRPLSTFETKRSKQVFEEEAAEASVMGDILERSATKGDIVFLKGEAKPWLGKMEPLISKAKALWHEEGINPSKEANPDWALRQYKESVEGLIQKIGKEESLDGKTKLVNDLKYVLEKKGPQIEKDLKDYLENVAKHKGKLDKVEDAVKIKSIDDVLGNVKRLTKADREQGFADSEFMKYVALAGAGAAAGGYFADDKVKGAVIGAALALGGLPAARALGKLADRAMYTIDVVAGKGLSKVTQKLGGKDERVRIDNLRRDWQAGVGQNGLAAEGITSGLKKLVPEQARREVLTHFIQGSRNPEYAPRTLNEQAYVREVQRVFKATGEAAQQIGVLDHLKNDGSYMTQLWDIPKDKFHQVQQVFSNMSKNTRFAHEKVIPSYEMGMSLGLTPKTLDGADIMRTYLNNVGRAMENKKLLDGLKTGVTPEGKALVVDSSKVAAKPEDLHGYETILHPQLQNMKVHPDIKPSLEALFSTNNPNAATQALLAVSAAAKRSLFSLSLFHAMSLGQALAAQGPSSWKRIPEIMRKIGDGEAADLAEQAIKSGVELSPHKGIDAQSDLVQGMLQKTGDWLDSKTGGIAGAPIHALRKVDEKLNTFLWGYIHPGFKLATFNAEYEKGLLKNAQLANEGKPILSTEEIGRNAASYVNDVYGGLNWREMAEGVQNKYGRDLALAMTSPAGQRFMQIAALAPDWTIATFRSGFKAIPGVSSPEIARLHRSYMFNSALMYLGLGDTLNMAFSGHHLWDNKDPSYIDLGNGQKMQLNKHFMEFFHWFSSPGQQAMNKLGYLPKEILTQLEGKEYLSTKRAPPMDTSATGRIAHAAKGILPISSTTGGIKEKIAGFMGVPIYGKTEEQKNSEKLQRKLDKLRDNRAMKLKGNQ